MSATAHGERLYAIGDIHGRLDLFEALIAAVEADDAARSAKRTSMVLLGDLVDRGPDSAGVVDLARQWQARRAVQIIKGNHEEQMLRALDDIDDLGMFLKFGGLETLLSYGARPAILAGGDLDAIQAEMRSVIPSADIAFLADFENSLRYGDYVFVHAGMRPGIPIAHQMQQDLRWIREPFLSHKGDFGATVVHGHTITEEPVLRSNRIGIDTGAYVYGKLTALGLEGTDRWLIQAVADADGNISITTL